MVDKSHEHGSSGRPDGTAPALDRRTLRSLARTFPALASRLHLKVPCVKVKCPQGHKMRVPAEYVAGGRELFCSRCRAAFVPGSTEVGEARERGVIRVPSRVPAPPAMDGLYVKVKPEGRVHVPDRFKPFLRRFRRRLQRRGPDDGMRARVLLGLSRPAGRVCFR